MFVAPQSRRNRIVQVGVELRRGIHVGQRVAAMGVIIVYLDFDTQVDWISVAGREHHRSGIKRKK